MSFVGQDRWEHAHELVILFRDCSTLLSVFIVAPSILGFTNSLGDSNFDSLEDNVNLFVVVRKMLADEVGVDWLVFHLAFHVCVLSFSIFILCQILEKLSTIFR